MYREGLLKEFSGEQPDGDVTADEFDGGGPAEAGVSLESMGVNITHVKFG